MTKVLRQQLERVPEDVRARILLATNLAYYGQEADEAIRHLKTAVALRPNDPNTLYNAACTYGVLGRKRKRSRRSRRRSPPAMAIRTGRRTIPISLACTMSPNSASSSASMPPQLLNRFRAAPTTTYVRNIFLPGK